MFYNGDKRHIGGEGRAHETGIPPALTTRVERTKLSTRFGSDRCGPGQCPEATRPAPDRHPRLHSRTQPKKSERFSRIRDAMTASGQGEAIPGTHPVVTNGLRTLLSPLSRPGRSGVEGPLVVRVSVAVLEPMQTQHSSRALPCPNPTPAANPAPVEEPLRA
jgi:hypothetical protein